MPVVWFGSDHTGTNLATLADEWVSVTVARPNVRTAMDGKSYFIVTKAGFKTAAAPSTKRTMKVRVSNASGSVHSDSYSGTKISWEKQANHVYTFQGLGLHCTTEDGKLRIWLYSDGPFYFARHSSGGSIQGPGGKTYAGYPVGWYEYVQVAQAPAALKATRKDSQTVTFSWKPWDIKRDTDAIGGGTSISGYVIQIARDAAFTDRVRYAYPSSKDAKLDVSGLYGAYDFYARIATRNEVSNYFKIPGGQWSAAVLIAGSDVDVDQPDPTDSGGDAPSDPSSGSDSNTPGSTGGDAGGGSLSDAQKALVYIQGQIAGIRTEVGDLQKAMDQAQAEPSSTTWKAARSATNPIKNDVNRIIGKATGSYLKAWQDALAACATAYDALSTAASDTAQTAKDSAKLAGYVARTGTAVTGVYNAVVKAKANPTKRSWGVVEDRLGDLQKVTQSAVGVASTKGPWQTATSVAQSAGVKAEAAAANPTARNVEAARAAAKNARDAARSAIKLGGAVHDGSFGAALNAFTALKGKINAAISATPPAPTTGDGDSGSDGSGPTIVFTPIPDTSYLRTQPGGLLLSRSARTAPGHTVRLMDRGGVRTLADFTELTKVEWNRIRDDQSVATITLDGSSARKNERALDMLEAGRHELCVYRGDERVWEGPITLPTWKRDQVVISAKDITHYLNRTVMHGGYSNAYPNLDYVVNRIAGIIANELRRKEALDPAVNVLRYMHTYVEEGDAKTSRVSMPAEMTVWQHLDDLAAKAGIDYTVIGRALHIWDTSRPALGRTRVVSELDFVGDTYISAYGMETATTQFVTDGQGNFGVAGGPDDYYGEIELVATAYDENQNPVNSDDTDPTNDTVSIQEMNDQAARNLKGRLPTPIGLHVPDGSGFRLDRGIGVDVLIPGVYVPVRATLSGRTVSQMLKLKELKVSQDRSGEVATVTLTPASASDFDDVEAGDDE